MTRAHVKYLTSPNGIVDRQWYAGRLMSPQAIEAHKARNRQRYRNMSADEKAVYILNVDLRRRRRGR